eukprot:gene1938-2116_t
MSRYLSEAELASLSQRIFPRFLPSSEQKADLALQRARQWLLQSETHFPSREDFLQVIAKQPSAPTSSSSSSTTTTTTTNPAQLHQILQWFNEKRTSLQQILAKYESRCQANASFSASLSLEAKQGMAILAALLKVEPAAMSDSHREKVLQVRVAIDQLRKAMASGDNANHSSSSSSSTAPPPAPAPPLIDDPSNFARLLCELFDLVSLRQSSPSQVSESTDRLESLKDQLLAWLGSRVAFLQEHDLQGAATALHNVMLLEGSSQRGPLVLLLLRDLMKREKSRLDKVLEADGKANNHNHQLLVKLKDRLQAALQSTGSLEVEDKQVVEALAVMQGCSRLSEELLGDTPYLGIRE